jgi:hypothetical protein
MDLLVCRVDEGQSQNIPDPDESCDQQYITTSLEMQNSRTIEDKSEIIISSIADELLGDVETKRNSQELN